MADLSEPTPELAARARREVGYEERLTGITLNQMAGTIPHDLYTLDAAASFLRVDSLQALLAPGGRASIHYIDPGALARWVGEVLGDTELADALREAVAQEEVYANQVGPVRALLEQRLEQFRRVAGKDKEPATGEKGA